MRAAAALPRAAFAVPPRRAFAGAPRWSVLVLAGTAAAIAAPLLSLLVTALRADAGLWSGLVAGVLPVALLETGLLLAGVALLCGTIGIATAWLVTAHRFPGRDWLVWVLPLPLAVPTYITA